jgi:hypothetical protein
MKPPITPESLRGEGPADWALSILKTKTAESWRTYSRTRRKSPANSVLLAVSKIARGRRSLGGSNPSPPLNKARRRATAPPSLHARRLPRPARQSTGVHWRPWSSIDLRAHRRTLANGAARLVVSDVDVNCNSLHTSLTQANHRPHSNRGGANQPLGASEPP